MTPIVPNSPAAPAAKWRSRALTPTGAPGDHLGTGELVGSFSIGLSYSADGHAYVLVHGQDGEYAVLNVGVDGTIGQVVSSGTLSSYCPAMLSYSVAGHTYWLAQAADGAWTSRELLADGRVGDELARGTLPFACAALTCCALGDTLYAVGPRAGGRGLLLFALAEGGSIGPVHERAWASDRHIFAFTQDGSSYLLTLMDGRFYTFEVSPEDHELALCAYDSLGLAGGDADATFACACVFASGGHTLVFAQDMGGAFVVVELFEGGRTWAEVCRGTGPTPYDEVLVVPRDGGLTLVAFAATSAPPLTPGVTSEADRTPHAAARLGTGPALRKATRAVYRVRELRAEGPADEAQGSGVLQDPPTHLLPFAAGSRTHNAVLACQEDGSYTIHELADGQIGRMLASGSLGGHDPVLFVFVHEHATYLLGHRRDTSWSVRSIDLTGVGGVIATGTLDAFYPALVPFKHDAHALGQREGGAWRVWNLSRGGLSVPRAAGTLGAFHAVMIPFGFLRTDRDTGFCLVHGETGRLDVHVLTPDGLGDNVATCDLGAPSEVVLPFTLGRQDATLLYTRTRGGAWCVRELIPARDRRDAVWYKRGSVVLPWLSEVLASGSRNANARTTVVLPSWPNPSLLELTVDRSQILSPWILQGIGPSGVPVSGAATGELQRAFSAAIPFTAGAGTRLFTHKESGEWIVHDLPGGTHIGKEIARGNLGAFHPSLLVYAIGGALYIFGQRVDGGYSTWRLGADGALGDEVARGSLPYFCPQVFPCTIGDALHGMGLRHTEGGMLLFALKPDGSVGAAQHRESEPDAKLYPFTSGGKQYVLSSDRLGLTIYTIDSKTRTLVRVGGAGSDDTHDTFVALAGEATALLLGQRLNGDWKIYSLSEDGSALTAVASGTCDTHYPSMHAVPVGGASVLFALSPNGTPSPLRAQPPGGIWRSAVLDAWGYTRGTSTRSLPSHVTEIVVDDYSSRVLLFGQGGSYSVHPLLSSHLGSMTAFGPALTEGDLGAGTPVLVTLGDSDGLFGHREDGSWFLRSIARGDLGPTVGAGRLDRFYRSVLDVSVGNRWILIGFDDHGWTVWRVSGEDDSRTLTVEQTGLLDTPYANFISFPGDGEGHILAQQPSGEYTVWTLSELPDLRTGWQLRVVTGGSFGAFCPTIRRVRSPGPGLSTVFAEKADGSYILRHVRGAQGSPDLSGTLGSYYPTAWVGHAREALRVFTSAPDPSPPGVQWFGQRLMPDGTVGENAVTGALGPRAPALLQFSVGSSAFLLLHEESGRYRTHLLDGAGGLGVERATGMLPHRYPTMCSFTRKGRRYWLGQREDGVYSVRPIRADGSLGEETSKGTLPFACEALFVYTAGAKQFCFGYDAKRTLLCEVWSTGTLGPAQQGLGVRGSRPFEQGGQQYFLAPAYTTYKPGPDGRRWEIVASEPIGVTTAAFATVSAGERQYVLWQRQDGHVDILELFEGGRRWSWLTTGSCPRAYDKLLGFSVAGLPFILGLSTQGACFSLVQRPRSDGREYPIPARSTIPVLTPPPPPEYLNLDPEELPMDILRASLSALNKLGPEDPFSVGAGVGFVQRQAQRYEQELAQRLITLSRGLVLGGPNYLVLPPMNLSFAKGFVLQMWVRPLKLVDNAVLFELEDPQDLHKRIALISGADGTVELSWYNQSHEPRTLILRAGLVVHRWQLLLFGFGPGDRAWVSLDGNEHTPRFLTAAKEIELESLPPDDFARIVVPLMLKSNLTPLEGERVRGYIGRGVAGGESTLNIGEVRLWNYNDAWQDIQRRSNRVLHGDELGLVGYWRPLDFQSLVRDDSPFGRHAHLVGKREEGPYPAPVIAYPSSDVAAHFPDERHDIFIKELPRLGGAGFTLQASVRLGGSRANFTLRGVERPSFYTVWFMAMAEYSALGASIDHRMDRRSVEGITHGPGVPPGSWVHLAVVVDATGKVSYFVNGEFASAVPLVLHDDKDRRDELLPGLLAMPLTYMQVGGGPSDIAEVRLWNRPLSNELVKSTTGRRIHRWAPGLIAYLRLDEDPALGERGPWVAGPDKLGESQQYVEFKANTGLALAPAPSVASPAVFSSELGVARLRKDITFPSRSSGFSVQLWLCARGAAPATALRLYRSGVPGAPTQLAIAWAPNENLTVTVRTLQGQEARVTVRAGLKLNEWAHLSVTVERTGIVCVYRDGILIGREPLPAYMPATTDAIELGANRRFTELRIWDRALTQAEVLSNWKLKLPTAPGLAQRLALDGNPFDFAGMPTESTAVFREDQAFQWGEAPPARQTIMASSELISELVDLSKVDASNPATWAGLPPEVTSSPEFTQWIMRASLEAQSGHPATNARPQCRMSYVAIDLLARGARGRPLPHEELTIVLSKPATLYWNSGRSECRIPIGGNRTFTAQTDASGRVRLLLKLENLAAPVFCIRHRGMGAGEWVIVTPDQVLHELLASLSPEELRTGRKASGTRLATQASLVTNVEHSEKLARMLRTMLGCAAAVTYEQQSTEALSFGVEDAPASTPLVPLHADSGAGVHVELPPDAILVRRIGRPLGMVRTDAGGDPTPQSFGFFDDIGDFFSDIGEMVVNTVEEVVDHIAVAIDTAIDGITIAFNAVVKTVEDMAGAVWNVMKTIGKTIMEVLNFLCGLFDFTDFIETSDYLLDQLNRTIAGARSSSPSLLTRSKELVTGLESALVTALGGADPRPSEPRQTDSAPTFDIDLGGPLGFVLGQVMSVFDGLVSSLNSAVGPILRALDDVQSKLQRLARDIAARIKNSDLLRRLGDLSGLTEGDPLDFIKGLVKDTVGILADLFEAMIDITIDVMNATFEVLMNVLNTRLDIPVLSWLFETLFGRSLSVGRLLSLILAIPLTLAHKLMTGSADGPFRSASPVSFGDDDTSADAAKLALRTFDLVLGTLQGGMNIAHIIIKGTSGWEDNAVYKPRRWARFALSVLKSIVRNNPHVHATLTGKSLEKMGETAKILSYAAWGCTCIDHACEAIVIHKGSRASTIGHLGLVFCVGAIGCAAAAALTSEESSSFDSNSLAGRLNIYDTAALGAFGAGALTVAVSKGNAGIYECFLGLWQTLSTAAMIDLLVSGTTN